MKYIRTTTTQIIYYSYFSHFQTSGEWCYSSQMGARVTFTGGHVGHGHAGYQSCSRDSQCTHKVSRCVGACTL